MKKLVLSMALLAGLALVSCNKDDDGGNSNCVTCTMEDMEGEIPVCKGENGNAFLGDIDTEEAFDDYIAGMEEVGADCN